MKKITSTFVCVDNAGNEYTIIERTEYHLVDISSHGIKDQQLVPGLKEYSTDDGKPCNRLDDDHFIIFPDEIVVQVKTLIIDGPLFSIE